MTNSPEVIRESANIILNKVVSRQELIKNEFIDEMSIQAN